MLEIEKTKSRVTELTDKLIDWKTLVPTRDVKISEEPEKINRSIEFLKTRI